MSSGGPGVNIINRLLEAPYLLLDKGAYSFIRAALERKGIDPAGIRVSSVPGDGSARDFFRIRHDKSEESYILVLNPPDTDTARRENRAYLMIGRHLRRKGIRVPKVYEADLGSGFFLLEDLGDTSLQDAIKGGQRPSELYPLVLEHLIKMQVEARNGFDPAWTCQTRRYNALVMRRFEAEYFVEAFLEGYLGLKGAGAGLKGSFDFLAQRASEAPAEFFMHRDFQSRNIMVKGLQIGILDWQGGRLGPLGYDLASLLLDPYVNLSKETREELFQEYCHQIQGLDSRWAEELKRSYPYLAIQRNLQVLGAFSFLSRVRQKPYFASYIPNALSSLKTLLEDLNHPRLSPLLSLLKELSL